jgi:hypothetical protein
MVNDAKTHHTSVCVFAFSQSLPVFAFSDAMSVRCARIIEIITRHTPHVDAMSADKDTRGIRILFHGLRHAILEVFLVWGVLDDRHLQSVEVGKGSLHAAYANAFDHLDFEKRRKLASVASNDSNTLPPMDDVHCKHINSHRRNFAPHT